MAAMVASRRPRTPLARDAESVVAADKEQLDGGQLVELLLSRAARLLTARAGSVGAARIEAEVLLASVLGTTRTGLLCVDAVPPEALARWRAVLDTRVVTARPVAYLTGWREFWDLTLAVDERVLVPRPETETLVEELASLIEAGRVPDGPLADLGTGSGAIGLVASRWRPTLAIDIESGAVAVAADNAQRLGLSGLCCVQADGLSCVRSGVLAAVLSNPPYVAAEDFAKLPADVREHEPRRALLAEDGVAAMYAWLAAEAFRTTCPGGWLLLELGAGQASVVQAELERVGWADVRAVRDLADIERVLVAQR